MAEAVEHVDVGSEPKDKNVKIQCKECCFTINRFTKEIMWKFIVSRDDTSFSARNTAATDQNPLTTTAAGDRDIPELNIPLIYPENSPPISLDTHSNVENVQPQSTSSFESVLEETIDSRIKKISLPEWIAKDIIARDWTHGSLLCFGCHSNLGGFDFRSNSDCRLFLLAKTVKFSKLSSRDMRDDISDDVTSSPSLCSITFFEGYGLPSLHILTTSDEESGGEWLDPPDNNSSQEMSSENEGISVLMLAAKRRKRRHKKRRKDPFLSRLKEGLKRKEERAARSAKERKESRLKQLLEAEPELQDLPDELVCPVCLDLLHEPYQVEPCGHIFCEPCLRRLGQKDPMNCPCPMCRTRIGFCKHLAATSREIREDHEGLYLRRKKFENGTPVFRYPLPWRPGWRNLIRGRPLGGNRFLPRDNRSELMRAIILQIPYYLPPVIIVNFINVGIFAFMMGIVEVIPSLIYHMTWHMSNSTASNITLDSSDVPEMSGDVLPPDADTDLSPQDDMLDVHAPDSTTGSPALDATFYYILFLLSLMAALTAHCLGLGQEDNGIRNFQRMSDLVLVVVVTCVPLLMLPTLLPFRDSDGGWWGDMVFRLPRLFLKHMNYHTVIFLIGAIWLVYHVDNADAEEVV